MLEVLEDDDQVVCVCVCVCVCGWLACIRLVQECFALSRSFAIFAPTEELFLHVAAAFVPPRYLAHENTDDWK